MLTRIRVLRLKQGERYMSEFAAKHKIPVYVLYRVEPGTGYVPLKYRQKLAKALGVRVEDILDERGFPLPA